MNKDSNKNVPQNILMALLLALVAFIAFAWQSLTHQQQSQNSADQYQDGSK